MCSRTPSRLYVGTEKRQIELTANFRDLVVKETVTLHRSVLLVLVKVCSSMLTVNINPCETERKTLLTPCHFLNTVVYASRWPVSTYLNKSVSR